MTSLLNAFENFYYEVLRQKERALRLVGSQTTPSDSIEPNSNEEVRESEIFEACCSIQRKLFEIIDEELSSFQMVYREQIKTELKDVEYIMVSLADEIFINLNWQGAMFWKNNLLESQRFHTQIAGELFFEKVEALLKTSNPALSEVAILYFLSLSLGFRGQYKEDSEHARIHWYLDQLYFFIYQKTPALFNNNNSNLIDQCYHYTKSDPPSRGLPDTRWWFICITSIVIIYFFFSYAIWYKFAADLYDIISNVFSSGPQNVS
ncbi:MAG: DotU family type IV/VI secretion system protein [Alphaproteobacteria bacterium]